MFFSCGAPGCRTKSVVGSFDTCPGRNAVREIKGKVMFRKFDRVVKIYIIRRKLGPVAKNATRRPSGWESNPRPLDYWTIALPLSYRSRCRQLGREFSIYINEMVMPVKYKGMKMTLK